MKGVQCYELFGGIALKNHAFLSIFLLSNFNLPSKIMPRYLYFSKILDSCFLKIALMCKNIPFNAVLSLSAYLCAFACDC